MQRDLLLGELAEYARRHPQEDTTVAAFREFVAAHPDCFERSLTLGHVTGSAWIVEPTGAAVLLTHHRKLGIWVQLGGHTDGEADVLAAARREGLEESGLPELVPLDPWDRGGGPTDRPAAPFDLDIHLIPARPGESAHHHYDVRYAFRATSRDFRVGAESEDLAWVDVTALDAYTREESMLRMARKWLRT